jgi:hypothetical protein
MPALAFPARQIHPAERELAMLFNLARKIIAYVLAALELREHRRAEAELFRELQLEALAVRFQGLQQEAQIAVADGLVFHARSVATSQKQ